MSNFVTACVCLPSSLAAKAEEANTSRTPVDLTADEISIIFDIARTGKIPVVYHKTPGGSMTYTLFSSYTDAAEEIPEAAVLVGYVPFNLRLTQVVFLVASGIGTVSVSDVQIPSDG